MQSMDRAAVQAIFNRFAAPLAPHVTSVQRKEAAEMLAKTLWLALIAGPEAEDEAWNAMRTIGGMDEELLEPIQQCYRDQMKPSVTKDELASLREQYRNRPTMN